MAWMIPATIPPDAKPGERRVFEALAALPDDYTVCYRRLFPGRRHIQEPDFVVIGADIGLIVLEIKDWRGPQPPEGDTRKNPLAQAKAYVHALQDLVRERGFPVLAEAEGRHAGDLVFPCVPAVALPFVKRDQLEELGLDLDPRHVLVREDLNSEVLPDRLCRLARLYFRPRLDKGQVDFLRGLVAPELCLEPVSAAGPPRQLDLLQAGIVTSDLHLPPPEQLLARDLSVRLVRGVAGSGKTLLLLIRAKLLQRLKPSWRVLVLTYNRDLAQFLREWLTKLDGDAPTLEITHFHKWCYDLLVGTGDWRDVLDERARYRLVVQAAQDIPGTASVSPEVSAKEIAWIKEYLEAPIHANYLAAKRTGRGDRLNRETRCTVLEIFDRYQGLLQQKGMRDWEDVPLRVIELIETGRLSAPRYHAILVDETQDFAPAWFRVILRMLRPETNLLFLVGDGAQRVYRRDLSWNRVGISLAGRSRILRRVYRNTVEIARYAIACVQDRRSVAEDLAEYGEEWIEADLDHPWTRHGADPILRGFETSEGEQEFLAAEIRTLLNQGHSPTDILVLQARRESAAQTAEALRRNEIPAASVKESGLTFDPPSVNVCTYHSAKGLEFPIVFCSMTHVFPEARQGDRLEDPKQMEAEAARLLYVGMTRARDLLYVTYQSR